MIRFSRLGPIAWLAALSIVGAGCATASSPEATAPSYAGAVESASQGSAPATVVTEQAQPETSDAVAGADSATTGDDPAMADHAGDPAWLNATLTDAHTGNAFTLADFAGKTVYVETFATWCGSCKQQLTNVKTARPDLGQDVVVVALSVEPNIGNDALKTYANDAGFDWVFAATSPEMLRDLADHFGQTVTTAPATPHFFIRPNGSVTELATGIEAPGEIVLAAREVQG